MSDLHSSKQNQKPDQKRYPIVYFDATVRRREKMKLASEQTSSSGKPGRNGYPLTRTFEPHDNDEAPAVQETPLQPLQPSATSTVLPMTSAQSDWPVPPPPSQVKPTETPAPVSARTQTTALAASTYALSVPASTSRIHQERLQTQQLAAFAVNFVVEQTGYPPDMVDLSADLEADLGIDSITLAQLLGEVRDYCGVTPTGDLSLSDFATLNDVVRIFQQSAADQLTSALKTAEEAGA